MEIFVRLCIRPYIANFDDIMNVLRNNTCHTLRNKRLPLSEMLLKAAARTSQKHFKQHHITVHIFILRGSSPPELLLMTLRALLHRSYVILISEIVISRRHTYFTA